MNKRIAAFAVAAAVAGTTAATVTAAPAGATRWSPNINLVHGIPGAGGFPVDITVNGAVIEDVPFTTVASVPGQQGQNCVEIRVANAPATSKPVLKDCFFLRKSQSRSVVAHLTAAGAPTITTYFDNQTKTGGASRVTVRHAAAAPAVDVIVNDALVLFDGLTNPKQAVGVVPPGSYSVDVVADADNSIVAAENVPLNLAANTNTIVFAVGDFAGGSFTLLPLVQPTR